MIDFQCKDKYNFQDLEQIMALLRAPGGCPWDREQTHQSIRRNMLEEAYEVVEAIDEESPAHLQEELGDVLLQVVFHACMAQEKGWFDLSDVVNGVAQKLVFRHPHVFGSVQAGDTDAALTTWDAQKKVEKGQKTVGDTLDAVPHALPALMRAEKIQTKARKAGFDWDETARAVDKLSEEVDELKQAIRENSNTQEELGDVLFAAAKVGRFLDIDSEQALHGTCEKFIRRFRQVEQQAGDKPLTDYSLPQLEEMWRKAKESEAK